MKKRGKRVNSFIRSRENFIYFFVALAIFFGFLVYTGNLHYTGFSVDEQTISESAETNDAQEVVDSNENMAEQEIMINSHPEEISPQEPIEEANNVPISEEVSAEPTINESDDVILNDFEEINVTFPEINETEENSTELNITYDINITEQINLTELINNTELNVTEFNLTEINVSENEVNISDLNLVGPLNVTDLNLTEQNVTINITNFSNEDILDFHDRVIVNQPVKWTKKINLEEQVNEYEFYLPEETISFEIIESSSVNETNYSLDLQDVLVEQDGIERPVGTTDLITGASVASFETFYYDFLAFFNNLFKFTGFSVYEDNSTDESLMVIIDEPVQNITVEYYLPGPTTNETNLTGRKVVELNNPDSYDNVYVLTEVNGDVENSIEVYRELENSIERVNFETIDWDNDNFVDAIGWNSTNETTQTFLVIIEIVGAQHLDINRSVISDIYNETKRLDGNWSEIINESEYVRVTFEINLTSANDVTIFPRTISGTPKIEIYEKNENQIIAQFDNLIDNQYNKVYLTNLSGTQDSFDLKISNGSLQFDHIIDPSAGFTGDTKGLAVYGFNGGIDVDPRYRLWNGSDFEGSISPPLLEDSTDVIEWVTVLSSPQRNQTAVAIVDSAGDVAVNVYNMSDGQWINSTGWWKLTNVGTTIDNFPMIDISVEDDTGDFLFVYESSSAANRGMAYTTFNGVEISTQGTFSFNNDAASEAQRVVKASRAYPGTSEILVAFAGGSDDISFARWDGNTFRNITTITTTSSAVDEERFAISWEYTTQDALVTWGADTVNVNYSYWSNNTKSFTTANGNVVNRGAVAQQVYTCGDPVSDYIALFVGPDSTSDALAMIWNGNDWTSVSAPTEDTSAENSASRNAVCSWTTNTSVALFVYDATTNAPTLGWFIYNKSDSRWSCPANGQTVTSLNSAQGSGGPCQTTNAMADDIETFTIHKDPRSNDIMFIGEGLTRDLEAWIFNSTYGLVQPTTSVLSSNGASCTTVGSCLGFDYNSYFPEEEAQGDSTPPAVNITFPQNNETYLKLFDLPFNFNVSLDENGTVEFSLDGGDTNYTMGTTDNQNFNYTLEELDVGTYTFSVYAQDSSGNKNFDENSNFTLLQENILVNGTVVDGSGEPLNVTVYIYDETSSEYVYNETNTTHETIIPLNTTYTLEILPIEVPTINKVEFTELNFSDANDTAVDIVNIDQLSNIDNFSYVFAIDQQLNISNATIYFTALSETLYKCPGWNFTSESCEGGWELYLDNLSVGQDYNFTISPGDPGYGIIEISNAVHLSENYSFISNIYDQVRSKDGVWSETIPDSHYVRVEFIKPLNSDNDITIYPRTISGTPKIEIYENGQSQIITEFTSINDNQYNTVYLENLTGTQNTFDLKILNGDVQFDHIIDPSYSTPGILVHGNNSATFTWYRLWNASSFTSAASTGGPALDAGSTPEWMIVKSSPTRNQSIVGISDSEGELAINVYNHSNSIWINASSWTTYGSVGTTVDNFKYWDIGTERLTGNFLIVFEKNTTADRKLVYVTWNGTTFSREQNINLDSTVAAEAQQNVVLTGSKNNSDEIAMLSTGGTDDLSFARWNGTGFYNITAITLDLAPVDEERFDFAWQSSSGDGLLAFAGNATGWINYTIWNDTTKSFTTQTGFVNRGPSTSGDQVHLCADPISNRVGAIIGADSAGDLLVMMWNGTNWEGTKPVEETAVENVAYVNARCAFNQNQSKALFMYDDSNNQNLRYLIYNSSDDSGRRWICPENGQNVTSLDNAFGSSGPCQNSSLSLIDDVEGIDLIPDPRSNDIMVVVGPGLQSDGKLVIFSLDAIPITLFSAPNGNLGQILGTNYHPIGFNYLRYFGPTSNVDNINPSVFDLVPVNNTQYYTGQIINISANVTDDTGVSLIYANITYPNSTIFKLNLNQVGSTDKYNASFTIHNNLTGLYNVTYYANDTSNNLNSTSKTNFTVAQGCVYGTNPPDSGSWSVSDSTLCQNMEIMLPQNGDILVYGNLTLLNVNITMNGTSDGGANISIPSGGKLVINVTEDSQLNRITSANTANEYSFGAYENSILLIDHANISELGWTTALDTGGLYIVTKNATIVNTNFVNNFRAFIIDVVDNEPSNIYIANINISNGGSNPFYIWDNLNGALFENIDAGGTHPRGIAIGGYNNTFINLKITDTTGSVGVSGAAIWRRGSGSYGGVKRSYFINSTIINGYDEAYADSASDNYGDVFINSHLETYDRDANDVTIAFANGATGLRNITFINTTFDKYDTSADAFTAYNVKWYLDVNANDGVSNLQNAAINISNSTNNIVYSALTNSQGNINTLNLTEYVQTSSGYFYETNYTINASKSGYSDGYKSVNLTQSYAINISLSQLTQVSCTRGTNPPISGDWNIGNDTLCENVSITLPTNGNLNITGNLTFVNVNLTLTPGVDGGANITVYNSGRFSINTSLLGQWNKINSTDTSLGFGFRARNGSNIEWSNVNISEVGWTGTGNEGGIYIGTPNATIHDANIKNNNIGFIINTTGKSRINLTNIQIRGSAANPMYLWDNVDNATFTNINAGNDNQIGFTLGGYNNTFTNLTIGNTLSSGIGATASCIWRRGPGNGYSEVRQNTYINSNISCGNDPGYAVSTTDLIKDMFIDSRIYAGVGSAIYLSGTFPGANLTLINVTLDKGDIYYSDSSVTQLDIRWYVNTNVSDASGNLQGATVTIKDKNYNTKSSQTTDLNGIMPRQNITELLMQVDLDVGGQLWIYDTNHTINATKVDSTHKYNQTMINLTVTNNTNVGLYINQKPTQVTLNKPDNDNYTTNRTPTLSWNSATDADGDSIEYTLLVDDDEAFGAPEVSINTTSTSYTLSSDLNLDTTYYWKVRAYDNIGNPTSYDYGQFSSTRNFTVQSLVVATLTTDTIDFGIVNRGVEYNTSDGSPAPFVIRNDGNGLLNVSLYSTQLFQTTALPNESYRFKANQTSEVNSFSIIDSIMSFFDMPSITGKVVAIGLLKYPDVNDEAAVDISIIAPTDEEANAKTATVTFEEGLAE